MHKKIIKEYGYIPLLYFLIFSNLCCYQTSEYIISPKDLDFRENIQDSTSIDILSIKLNDGRKFDFDKNGGTLYRTEANHVRKYIISGFTKSNDFIEADINKVDSVRLLKRELTLYTIPAYLLGIPAFFFGCIMLYILIHTNY
jgi:hypothetical protein